MKVKTGKNLILILLYKIPLKKITMKKNTEKIGLFHPG